MASQMGKFCQTGFRVTKTIVSVAQTMVSGTQTLVSVTLTIVSHGCFYPGGGLLGVGAHEH